MNKLYFGHPVNIYGTKEESKLQQIIEKIFPKYHIENPNQSHHEKGYQKYREIEIDGKKTGMNYFFFEVLPLMSAGIFLTFNNNLFGHGVYSEAEFIQIKNNGPIYEIGFRKDNGIYIAKMVLKPSRCLSIQKTREEVYGEIKDNLRKSLNLALNKGPIEKRF